MKLSKKKKITIKKKQVDELEQQILAPLTQKEEEKEGDLRMISTGSTLLDLAISGGIVRGGGIPSGVMVEIFGPSAAGKTALLCEIAASVQGKGGEVVYLDPEGRLNTAYTKIYGADIDPKLYTRPDTVGEMFSVLKEWEPENITIVNMVAADSLAALSTDMEMEDEDKMGMRRAKEFSAGFRKQARRIAKPHKLLVCSNQEREGGTPGGKAVGYYSSIRIRIAPDFKGSKIEETKNIRGKSQKKLVGIKSKCVIKKSSIDHPAREALIYILFDYGVDDIRGNLQYLKENTGNSKYEIKEQSFARIKTAIEYIEENQLENVLKNEVIDLWEEIEKSFRTSRKKKKR